MRDSEHRQYTREWLQVERPQPMYDSAINAIYNSVLTQQKLYDEDLVNQFKNEFMNFINGHCMNIFKGLDTFMYSDVCIGCTQYIDDIYQRIGSSNVMIFENDYKYHWRLNNNIVYTTIDTLDPSKELIISAPFPYYGDLHPDIYLILDRCLELKIPVHLDCAWLFCSKGIFFDFTHPAIKTVCVSLSKAGLGSDRIALRFSNDRPNGAISIMNDFNMNCKMLMHVGIKFMQDIGPEYFWKKYGNIYNTVCEDFDLIPTKAIHVARTIEGGIVGIRPLLRAKYSDQNPRTSLYKMNTDRSV